MPTPHIYIYIFFGGGPTLHVACGILVPRPGIEPRPPAVEAWSLNHWTAREVPHTPYFSRRIRFLLSELGEASPTAGEGDQPRRVCVMW